MWISQIFGNMALTGIILLLGYILVANQLGLDFASSIVSGLFFVMILVANIYLPSWLFYVLLMIGGVVVAFAMLKIKG